MHCVELGQVRPWHFLRVQRAESQTMSHQASKKSANMTLPYHSQSFLINGFLFPKSTGTFAERRQSQRKRDLPACSNRLAGYPSLGLIRDNKSNLSWLHRAALELSTQENIDGKLQKIKLQNPAPTWMYLSVKMSYSISLCQVSSNCDDKEGCKQSSHRTDVCPSPSKLRQSMETEQCLPGTSSKCLRPM